MRGDVWAAPDDASRLAAHLKMDVETLAETYGRLEVEGWIQFKERPEGGCIFLSEDGKACSVYEGRPVQVVTHGGVTPVLRVLDMHLSRSYVVLMRSVFHLVCAELLPRTAVPRVWDGIDGAFHSVPIIRQDTQRTAVL